MPTSSRQYNSYRRKIVVPSKDIKRRSRKAFALKRIARLENEILQEVSYWTLDSCMKKLEEIEKLMLRYFPVDFKRINDKNVIKRAARRSEAKALAA